MAAIASTTGTGHGALNLVLFGRLLFVVIEQTAVPMGL